MLTLRPINASIVGFLDFTSEGTWILLAVVGGPLALGLVIGALRLHGLIRLSLFVLGPVVAIVAYHFLNPEPGCNYDCIGSLAIGIILAAATVAWWIGLLIASAYRQHRDANAIRSERARDSA